MTSIRIYSTNLREHLVVGDGLAPLDPSPLLAVNLARGLELLHWNSHEGVLASAHLGLLEQFFGELHVPVYRVVA